jgi:protein-export membrane protein SecD/preprotein translocase SecF subunit
MLNRLLVTLGAGVFCIFLLLLEHKCSYFLGTQDLVAEVRQVDAAPDAKSDAPKVFHISLKDLGGSLVRPQADDLENLKERLAGSGVHDQKPITVVDASLSDTYLALTVPAKVTEEELRSRVTAVAFKRSNPPEELFHTTPGIDLRGGVEFICSLHKEDGSTVPADDDVMRILRGRLDERGLTEPQVTRLSNGEVDVVIPGGTPVDASRTRKVLETSGKLEFRHVIDPYLANGERYGYILTNSRFEHAAAVIKNERGQWDINPARDDLRPRNRSEVILPDKEQPNTFYLCGRVELTGADVASASQIFEDGRPEVGIEFTALGAARNYNFTHQAKEEQNPPATGTGHIAIVYDGQVVSAPIVIQPSSANCSISGIKTTEEIDSLRTVLRGGSLSVTPVVLSERVLGATLGEQTVSRAETSMGVSFFLIVAFMWLYYRRLGTVANLCLIATSFFVWSILSLFGATITLPGLAGLVLTIGMAVDTNILIFERIREELAEEHGLKVAIGAGYDRAFWTIVDAHLTTFITAFILYLIGTGPVKGFGLTLMIGIVVNLFSGMYIGRLLTDWLTRSRQSLSMAHWVPVLKLQYVEWRWIGYIFSIVTAVAGLGWFACGHLVQGGSFERNFDIDFTGGNAAQVVFDQPKTQVEVNDAIQGAYGKDSKQFNLLSPHELRIQPYFASLGGDHRASREWVFRARDEEGGRLETLRSDLERQRLQVEHQIEDLREKNGTKDPEAKKLELGALHDLDVQIHGLTDQISGRTETFTHQLAAAFGSSVGVDGDEILKASVNASTVGLTVAVLDPITPAQLASITEHLKAGGIYTSVTATSGEAPPSLSIVAELKDLPESRFDLDAHDPIATRLQTLLTTTAKAPVAAAVPVPAPAPAAPAVPGAAHVVAAAPAPAAPVVAPPAPVAVPPTPSEVVAAEALYSAIGTSAAASSVTVAKPFPSSEHFSGQVAGQMKWRALLAILISLLAILAYVAARFEFRFGLGAVVALFHDVALTVGLVSLLGIRIDLTVIAALLTIIGYSINGTIVTFDRVRENLRKLTAPLPEIIDISIAQTMPRTVLTNTTVILTVLVLWIYGGDALHGFTSTLLIGLLSGAYSSVFVAPPLLLTFTRGIVAIPPEGGVGGPGSPAALPGPVGGVAATGA